MKKLLILAFITLSVVNAWEIKEVIDSEGTQTNIIKCDNGSVKVIYLNNKTGEYEVTPTIKFDNLDKGIEYICR